MFMISTRSMSPSIRFPPTVRLTFTGLASATALRKASRPFSSRFATDRSARIFRRVASASAPMPTASTKRRSPHGPLARQTSRRRSSMLRQPAMISSAVPAMPRVRATLFAVPRGRTISGMLRSGSPVTTRETVPSPPAAITMSAGRARTSARSSFLASQYLGDSPASSARTMSFFAAGRDAPASGLWMRVARIVVELRAIPRFLLHRRNVTVGVRTM